MFRVKTLLVIGAGASCEYGFPAGAELKSRISALVNIRYRDGWSMSSGDPMIRDALKQYVDGKGERDINPYLHKAWQMAAALPVSAESIDNFLFNHSDDSDMVLIGKLGIARAILQAERASKLRPTEAHNPLFDVSAVSETWLMRLATILVSQVKKSQSESVFDNLDIITFNYDRTIEHFLPQVISSHFGTESNQVRDALSQRSVIHPYGQVGLLPADRQTGVGFGAEPHSGLLSIAEQVRTFDEGVADTSMLNRIKTLVADAEQIVFLGFGFHRQNLDILSPDCACAARRLFATFMGLSQSTTRSVLGELSTMLGKTIGYAGTGRELDIETTGQTAGSLISENARLLTS